MTEIIQGASLPEVSHFVFSKRSTYLAQFAMHSTDIKVNDGRKSAILNLIKLTFFQRIPPSPETTHFLLVMV